MSILQHFGNKTPRQSQTDALTYVESNWDSSDVFVVDVPTAGGKTAIALTIAAWAASEKNLRSAIIVPTNILQSQYEQESPTIASKHRAGWHCSSCPHQSHYIGPRGGLTKSCKDHPECKETKTSAAARTEPVTVSNYYTYYANRLYKDILIVDEAHLLLNTLKDLSASVYWKRDYDFPDGMEEYGEVLEWATTALKETTVPAKQKKLTKLIEEMESLRPSNTLTMDQGFNRGKTDTCIKLLPLDARKTPPWFWPMRKVKKIVMLSATIGKQDIIDMNLDKHRQCYFSCSSPIEPNRRPIQFVDVAPMNHQNIDSSVETLAMWIDKAASETNTKGLVHATYKVAELLRHNLTNPRFIFHTKDNRSQQLERFKRSKDGIFVASGLYEGVDLAYKLARWQVITQVPFPSLDDVAIREKMETDEGWYKWQAAKSLLQAAGRVCRAPDDWGVTFVCDTQFSKFFVENKDILPPWFIEAVIGIKETDHATV
jgi:Rad3-related DNA helicase